MPTLSRTINIKLETINTKLKFQVKRGFTLIELLIVIAILGILAAAVLVAINPGKRVAQARDAQRRSDINAIANALTGYYAITGTYPAERRCDSSIGSHGADNCPINLPQNNWGQTINDKLYQELIVNQQFLKKLPVDPKNDATYYYKYEPGLPGGTGGFCSPTSTDCWYWIGTLLEEPQDPAKSVFRCTDNPLFAAGAGCKEVSAGTLGFNTVIN